jgi:putative PIN family toxin of toxin-antitoxin system
MRVVFDTNVWVSALITPSGVAARLLALLAHFQSVTSAEILAEVEKVLHYDKIQQKRGLSDEEIAHYLQLIQRISQVMTVSEPVELIREDPSDNKFLACARAGEAAYIISGDPHLTRLGNFEQSEIIAPGEFLKRLKPEK